MSDGRPSSSGAGSQRSGASSSNTSFAFLVHSQDTLPRNLPPDVDNKSLARQKRRRTSPEDQAILEEEYRRNPKPDKAARMSLVSRVALGEKEVQIWFQNRRQNMRRKSKPLLPHEVLPSYKLRQSSSDMAEHASPDSGHEMSSSQSVPSSSDPTAAEHAAGFRGVSAHDMAVMSALSQDSSGGASEPLASQQTAAQSQDVPPDVTSDSSTSSAAASFECGASRGGPPSQQTNRPGLGYISNRRNAPASTTGSDCTLPGPPPLLKRTSSLVRLSMSLEGKAQVVTGEDISPPRPRPARPQALARQSGVLQRSQSLGGLGDLVRQSTPQRPRHTPCGRSKDSRTWEFYCDSDARNALSAQAEQEQSGSAAGAIELLRSRSTNARAASRPNGNKRTNTPASKGEPTKRVKTAAREKPKLARASSSLARLQAAESHTPPPKPSPTQVAAGAHSPSGESDKENWLPGTHVRAPSAAAVAAVVPSQPESHERSRPILREKAGVPTSLASPTCPASDVVAAVEAKSPPRIFEDDTGDEAGRRGAADLDCVQNLLRLSQGNWR
ncbi:MAG: hypothetical protein M1832_003943 [Thelocarpon impressellum]|nr:MAG: hypothetical protein M1832_003943 [Thelocarpon impressellum]